MIFSQFLFFFMTQSTKGGFREGAGRPKSENPKNKRLSIKITEEQHNTIQAFSKERGQKITFLVLKALEEQYNISLGVSA